MRFWLKAIADFFEQLFSYTEADDIEGSLGTSPSAPASPAEQTWATLPPDAVFLDGCHEAGPDWRSELTAHLDFDGQSVKPISQAARRRVCKAFRQYADEHIK